MGAVRLRRSRRFPQRPLAADGQEEEGERNGDQQGEEGVADERCHAVPVVFFVDHQGADGAEEDQDDRGGDEEDDQAGPGRGDGLCVRALVANVDQMCSEPNSSTWALTAGRSS